MKSAFLILFLSGWAIADTGFTNTIQVTETDNSPKCQAGQIKVSPGSLTCSGQTATITTGGGAGGGGVSVLAVATGSASGFVGAIISSPTAAINFDSMTFTASLKGGATAFISTVIPSTAANILIPFGNYGSGLQTNSQINLSSAVPTCEEVITPNSVYVSTLTFFEGTSFSSHVALGFYDSTCTKIIQSTITASNGFNDIKFSPPWFMTGGTKYFLCGAVDANAFVIYSSPSDREGYLGVMANHGEPSSNFHNFTAGNSSTVNAAGTATVLPTTCGTRTGPGNATASTFGLAVH